MPQHSNVKCQFYYYTISQEKPLRMYPLPLALPKEREERSSMALGNHKEVTPEASFTLRRGYYNSSSWFPVLYTIRETSLVKNYRNDP